MAYNLTNYIPVNPEVLAYHRRGGEFINLNILLSKSDCMVLAKLLLTKYSYCNYKVERQSSVGLYLLYLTTFLPTLSGLHKKS